jgi:hypothetical protein
MEYLNIFSQLYDRGDYCLKTSLYITAKFLWGVVTNEDRYYYNLMIEECRLNKVIWNRKSSIYKWSNSGSEDPGENTFMKRPTKWIYEHILKYFNIDPFKGLSGDQLRSYLLTLYLNNDWWGALRLKLGFLIRLGLTPSLCEFAPVKPQAYVLLFKIKYPFYINFLWRPLYYFCKLMFYISYKRELKVPVEVSTTNKISLLPTAYLLNLQLPTNDFITSVYKTYFGASIVGEKLATILCILNSPIRSRNEYF